MLASDDKLPDDDPFRAYLRISISLRCVIERLMLCIPPLNTSAQVCDIGGAAVESLMQIYGNYILAAPTVVATPHIVTAIRHRIRSHPNFNVIHAATVNVDVDRAINNAHFDLIAVTLFADTTSPQLSSDKKQSLIHSAIQSLTPNAAIFIVDRTVSALSAFDCASLLQKSNLIQIDCYWRDEQHYIVGGRAPATTASRTNNETASTMLHAEMSNEVSSLPIRPSDDSTSVGPMLTPESYQTLLEHTERELSHQRNHRAVNAEQTSSRLRNPLHYTTTAELTETGRQVVHSLWLRYHRARSERMSYAELRQCATAIGQIVDGDDEDYDGDLWYTFQTYADADDNGAGMSEDDLCHLFQTDWTIP